MKVNNFRGYKYRRYTVALRLLALAWLPYALHVFFIQPGFLSAAAALFLAASGSIPLWIFSRHTEYISKEEFSRLYAVKGNQPKTLLGVVGPKKD